MKIEIGDKVEFLDAVGEGKVVRVDGDICYVAIDDDFEIPYKANKLKVVTKAENSLASSKGYEHEEEENQIDISQIETSEENFYLAVVKNEFQEVECCLINNTDYKFFVTFNSVKSEMSKSVFSGMILPNTIINIENFNVKYVKRINVQAIYLGLNEFKTVKPIDKQIQINSSVLDDSKFEKTDYLIEKANLISLTKVDEKYEINPEEIKSAMLEKNIEAKDKSKKYAKNIKPEDVIKEVDLHINKLVESVVGLGNFEILSIQVQKFRDELNAAIKNKNKQIVFIHGVGNGTLKQKIREILNTEYITCNFEDASLKLYGVGATLININ
jgi:hypothetical protein